MFAILNAVVSLITFYILYRIITLLLTGKYCQALIADKARFSASLPARLCAAIIPKSRIFRSVSLPIPGKDGQEIQLGTVIVSRAGIFIICQINGAGILENPSNGKWKHISSGKFTEFENPFTNQADARALLEYYCGLYVGQPVSAYSLVIYTEPSLKFTYQKPRGVICINDFPSRLAKMEKSRRLSAEQIRAACKMLSQIQAY